MKVFILFCLFAASQASVLIGAPALLNTGTSNQYRSQDNLGNYAFGYDEGHLSGGTFRRESGDSFGNKFGSYGLRDADGRVRIVNYIADAAGFRADIKTNEPGVEPKDPASTTINKAGLLLAAPAVHHAVAYPSPVHVAPVAPIAYAARPHTYIARPHTYIARPHTYVARPHAYAARSLAYVAQPVAYAHTVPVAGHYGYYHL